MSQRRNITSTTVTRSALDPSRRVHFSPKHLAPSLQGKFERLQEWVLAEGPVKLPAGTLVLGCLLAFEALLSEADLRSAYLACPAAVRCDTEVRIDWSSERGRNDARVLSCLTTRAIELTDHWPSFGDALDLLLRALPAELREGSDGSAALDALLAGARAWALHVLAPVLFGHVAGEARLWALSRATLARRETRLALQAGPSKLPAEPDPASERTYARAFNAALLGQSSDVRTAAAFLEKLIAALRAPTKGSNASKRRSVQQQLVALTPLADDADEFCALLFAFGLTLAESGTQRKALLAPTTPYSYVQSFARQFYAQLNRRRLAELSEDDYAQIYAQLLPKGEPAPSYLAAGLQAFHRFLRCWWTVPPLPSETFNVSSDAGVSANVIWPHERQLLGEWLQSAPDSRFTQQLRAALAISSETMIRARELTVLRMRNVIDEDSSITIEIARDIVDGTEKSKEGRRRIFLSSPDAMVQVRAWCQRRMLENAASDSYLFGDPADPQRVADAGRMHFWLNKLLKAVTGDPTISLHTWRHSYATNAIEQILVHGAPAEASPMDELANVAGHVGAHITAGKYAHLYERGLRTQLDASIIQRPLQYTAAAIWSGASEVTLRKRVSRATRTSQGGSKALWTSIRSRALAASLPFLAKGIQVCPATMPDVPVPQVQPQFGSILQVLRDCAAGLSTVQIAHRVDLRPEHVEAVLQQAGQFASAHGRQDSELIDVLALGIRALRDRSGRLLGMRPDFRRLRQPRWQMLAAAIPHLAEVELKLAYDYWARSVHREHLAVRPGRGWPEFAKLLQLARINRSQVALAYIRDDCAGRADAARARTTAQGALWHALGGSVREIEREPRAGRPPVWLVIGSRPDHLDGNGAANSISGLHCCLLAAGAWLQLKTLVPHVHE